MGLADQRARPHEPTGPQVCRTSGLPGHEPTGLRAYRFRAYRFRAYRFRAYRFRAYRAA
ncbi:hypothetical protein GCM10022224_063570 [Nonomuraea antimicrobica]|uniref:Uncharacterized protein n=1 Tax=Nonomuraea antimicrobica TaxID=561173 RepID=A0ABP7CID2_9ACTN